MEFPNKLISAMKNIIKNETDKNRALLVEISWIWCYFCLKSKVKIKEDMARNIFPMEFQDISKLIKGTLEAKRTELIRDTRWAGAAWNSENGLWGPLLRSAKAIRDNMSGPDFMPDNV